MARITYDPPSQSAINLAVTELNNTTTYASVYISCNGRSSSNLAYVGQRVYTSRYWYLSGLSPGTSYYASFNITSSGGSTASGGTYFMTQSAPQPPSAPSYVSAYPDTSSPGGVTISWPSSSGADYYTATIRNSYGSYITDRTVYGTSTYFSLSSGTSYTAYVIAYNSNGQSYAATTSFTTASPPYPSAVSYVSVSASTTSYGLITVYFPSASNASYYTITIRDAYGNYINSYTVYSGGSNYSYSLSPGTYYQIGVTSYNSYGSSGTTWGYVTTNSPPHPSPVSYVSVTAHTTTYGRLVVYFPSASNATSYYVTIRLNNTSGSVVAQGYYAATTNHNFDLTQGSTYVVGVTTYNSYGSSSTTWSSAIRTNTAPLPSAVSSVSVSASTSVYGRLIVYFPTASNATSYYVTIRLNSTSGSIVASGYYAATTNHNFDLTQGSTYVVGVTSYNSYGSSSTTWSSAIRTNTAPMPSPVSSVSVSASTSVYGRLIVYFSSASNATSYYVTIRQNNTSGSIVDSGYYTAGTNHNFDLTQGSTYVVGVTSYNSYGSSSTTWSSAIQTNSEPLPSPVSYVSVSASTSVYGRLTVYFPSASNAASYYVTIRQNNTSGSIVAQDYYAHSTNHNFDLTQGATYVAGVTSYNTQGKSSSTTWSSAIETNKEPLPGDITGLNVTTSTSSPPSVTATWNAATNVNTYRIELYTSSGTWTGYSAGISSSATRSYTFNTGLSEYTNYYVKIYGQNNSGNGNPSNSSSIRTGDFTNPTISISGVSGLGSITLSWNASDSGSGLASSNRFQTYIGTRNGGQETLATSGYTMATNASWTLDANDISLITDSVYWVGVRAYDNVGRSTVVSTSVTYKSTRPSNWDWATVKSSGGTFSLTAAEWNNFTARINQFRLYKGLSQYSFTTVVSGNTIFASQINEAIIAIRAMATELPSQVSGGNATASFINSLKNTLNSIT